MPVSVQAISELEEMLWISDTPPEGQQAYPPCIREMLARGQAQKHAQEDGLTQVRPQMQVQAETQTDTQTDTHSDAQPETQSETQSDAQLQQQTDKQSDRSSEGQPERQTSVEDVGRGRHRVAAILAAFLGQAGYERDEAHAIWSGAAQAEERIFERWYKKMHSPKCRALQRKSRGYPDLGIADLGLCRPDQECGRFEGPVEYACRILTQADLERGCLIHIKTKYLARVFDWSTGREGEIELTRDEKESLEALLAELSGGADRILVYTRARVRGRLRPRFSLREQEGPRRRMLSDVL